MISHIRYSDEAWKKTWVTIFRFWEVHFEAWKKTRVHAWKKTGANPKFEAGNGAAGPQPAACGRRNPKFEVWSKVWRTFPVKEVMLAARISRGSNSNAWHKWPIISLFRLHAMLTTQLDSPALLTCSWESPEKNQLLDQIPPRKNKEIEFIFWFYFHVDLRAGHWLRTWWNSLPLRQWPQVRPWEQTPNLRPESGSTGAGEGTPAAARRWDRERERERMPERERERENARKSEMESILQSPFCGRRFRENTVIRYRYLPIPSSSTVIRYRIGTGSIQYRTRSPL